MNEFLLPTRGKKTRVFFCELLDSTFPSIAITADSYSPVVLYILL